MSSTDRAYVALLHGHRSEFFLYALLLGHRLHALDPQCLRLLLVGRSGSTLEADYSPTDRSCLQKLWDIKEVGLVDVPTADKTRGKRHRFVFTKLHMFRVDVRKVVFFDLDVIVRSDPSELFLVRAPAGMYHGGWDRMLARHGEELPASEAFGSPDKPVGCINAGLLRIDPNPSETERELQATQMFQAASQLLEDDASYLPEQYLLVRMLFKWQHIDVKWNCEIGPMYYLDDDHQVVSLASKLHHDWVLLGNSQVSLQENVHMFHFSGTWLEPWWFIHLFSEQGFAFVQHQMEHRDPRGMVALAVYEWLHGIEQMRRSSVFATKDQQHINEHISSLAWTASQWWEVHTTACTVCSKLLYFCSSLGVCEECKVKQYVARSGDFCLT